MKPIFILAASACASALALITSLSFPAYAQESRTEVKPSLIGTWSGQMLDSDGSAHGDIKLEITADTITATNPRGGQVMGAGTYEVSASNGKVTRIEAKGTSGQFQRKSYEGILSIEGKTLKWCSANDNPHSKRPTELKTNMQRGQFLMVLEKQ